MAAVTLRDNERRASVWATPSLVQSASSFHLWDRFGKNVTTSMVSRRYDALGYLGCPEHSFPIQRPVDFGKYDVVKLYLPVVERFKCSVNLPSTAMTQPVP